MSIGLYLVFVPKPEENFFQKILPFLPKNSQIKILKNRFLADQWRATLSELLLRKMLAQELTVSPDALQIEVDNYGKPFLKDKKRHFNLSHAENVIILATDNNPIGIDVECVYSFNDLDQLLMQFSEEEISAYQKKPKEQRVNFFYDLWTLKESYIKALGKGLSVTLNSFSISISGEKAHLFRGIDSDTHWYFKRYIFGIKYKCAVCARCNQFPNTPSTIEPENLLNLYC